MSAFPAIWVTIVTFSIDCNLRDGCFQRWWDCVLCGCFQTIFQFIIILGWDTKLSTVCSFVCYRWTMWAPMYESRRSSTQAKTSPLWLHPTWSQHIIALSLGIHCWKLQGMETSFLFPRSRVWLPLTQALCMLQQKACKLTLWVFVLICVTICRGLFWCISSPCCPFSI